MSHFTVLVVGPDPHDQLERYDENLAHTLEGRGDEVDVRKQYVEEEFAPALAWAKANRDKLPNLNMYDKRAILEEYRGEPVHVDDVGHFVWDATNPEGYWDWWVVGGRWAGFFAVKPGTHPSRYALGEPGVFDNTARYDADVCYRGDVDLERMRKDRAEEAARQYAKYETVIAGTPVPRTWEEVRFLHEEDIEAARQAYHDQPRIKALAAADMISFFEPVEVTWGLSREAFIERERLDAIITHAIVQDGEWREQATMGWFGMSHDQHHTQEEWSELFNRWFEDLPPDTLLTLVDAHV